MSGAAAVPWIVILMWNSRDRLSISLGSMPSLRGEHETLVVDNGSTDGSVGEARKMAPWAHMLENGTNLGFAEGNNRGIAYALARGATHVALVNDDMQLDPDWLVTLLADEKAHPEAGILGGLVLFMDRPEVVNSTGIEIDTWMRARDRDFGRPVEELQPLDAGPVLAVTGGAMLISRRVLERVGMLDGRLFAYYEDYDLCRRAREHGFEVRFVPRAVSYHKFAASLGRLSPMRRYLLSRNQMIMVGRYARIRLAGVLLFGTALYRMLVRGPGFLFTGKPGLCRAEVRAAVDGLIGGCRELRTRWS